MTKWISLSAWYSRVIVAATLLLVTVASLPAWAQRAGFHGRVFALAPDGDITGVVPGANVEFKNQAGATVCQLSTNQGGYYRAHLPPGTYIYKVTAEGFKDEDVQRGIKQQRMDGYAVFNFSLSPGENDPDRVTGETVPLEIGTLRGRVLENTARGLVAVPGASISLTREGSNSLAMSVVSGIGDGSHKGVGEYEVILDVGTWRAAVSAQGFETLVAPRPIQISSGRETSRNFILTRPIPIPAPQGQGLKGSVFLHESDTAADKTPGVAIIPVASSTEQSVSPSIDARGNFHSDLDVGRYEVVAQAEGYRTARSGPRVVYAGRYTHVDLALMPLPKIEPPMVMPTVPTPEPTIPQPPPGDLLLTVTVFESAEDDVIGKRPLTGASVRVIDEAGQPVELQPTSSDNQGRANFAIASAGTFTVAAHKIDDGYAQRTQTAQVTADGVNRVEILLAKTATPAEPQVAEPELTLQAIERVRDGALRVVPGATVIVRRDGRPEAAAKADRDGRYTAKLGQGEYQIEVAAEGYEPGRLNVVFDEKRHLCQIERTGPDGMEHLVAKPTVVQHVLLTRHEVDEAPPWRQPSRDVEPPEETGRIVVQVVERTPGVDDDNPREIPIEGARVEIRLGEAAIDSGTSVARGGATDVPRGGFISKPLRIIGGYYAFVEKSGYHPAEKETPIEEDGVHKVVLRRMARPEEPPWPKTPPRDEPPDEAELAVLQVQVISAEGRPVPGADVEVHWGPEGRDIVRGRGSTKGAQGIAEIRLPREHYWVLARAALPRLGPLEGRAEVPRDWDPAAPIPVRLEGRGHTPGEPVEPPFEKPPHDMEVADLLVRVLDVEGRPVPGADVEVHWGPPQRDEIRGRARSEGQQGLARLRLPRENYWVLAKLAVPRRGVLEGRAGVPRTWNSTEPITVRLEGARDTPGSPTKPPPPKPPQENRLADLQVQVLGPDGQPVAGADVEIHWGSEERDHVRGRGKSQGARGIASIRLPRDNYWARARATLPRTGTLEGRVGVPETWNPAVPIPVHLQGRGGPTPPKPPPGQAVLLVRVLGRDLNAPISVVRPLAGARVTVRGNGGHWPGNTNDKGEWSISLHPGHYQIEATSPAAERPALAELQVGTQKVTKELIVKLRGPR